MTKKGFMERRRGQLEDEERTRVREALDGVVPDQDAMDEASRPALPRKLAGDYYDVTSSWMHRFSEVRRDDRGFHILHGDNPDAWRMKEGDLLQDAALNQMPYWQVSANEHFREKRVSLIPFGSNPFLTGIGAGGARITMEDIKVITGEYEEEKVRMIWEAFESGKIKNISSVAYVLLGTVGVNFGPNGPQGGWYNPSDTYSNRGGRKGMTAEEIVVADAETLQKMGFLVSDAIFDGQVSPYDWGNFVSNTVGYFKDWSETPPADTEIFKQRRLDEYRSRGLLDDEQRRESLTLSLDSWDYAITLWLDEGGFTPDEVEGYDYREFLVESGMDNEITSDVHRRLKGMAKWQAYSTHEEDPSNIANAIMLLGYPQDDVQMRAVGRCLMHLASADDKYVVQCYAALLRFLEDGHGYWLVNEAIILFFSYFMPDPQPLIVASKLPDGTNRKYAYWGLAALKDPYINQAIFTEDNSEALGSIVSALVSNDFLPGRHETYFLKEKLMGALQSESTITRFHARDGLATLVRLLRKQELEWEDASDAIREYDDGVRLKRNPSDGLSDEEWIGLTLDHMHRTLWQHR